ncbi:MAG TPA: zinc-binding dehydrogenase [Planctomycetota bacterium]|nr:zinc-binding dehydrogenase [Planctomycetota bacterium]
MRGVKILDALKVETCDYPDPVPQGEEVVVRLEAAAICGSDLHGLYQRPGEKPFVPGHEGAGVVVAVDKPRVLKVGDRVCTTAVYPCGVCDHCRMGYTIYCRDRKGTYGFGLNGVHATHVRICERSLLPLPDSMSFEQGSLVLDPVGTHFHANKRMGTNARHTVAVFGLGPMGLGAVCVTAFLGARVIAVDPIAFRRELAKKLGAADAVDPAAGDVAAQIRELTKGYGLDRAFECSGRPEPLYAALDLVRHFGHVSIVGEQPEAKISPSNHFNRKEITLSGSTCFPLGEYDEIVRAFEAGLPAARMITHRFTVEQAAEAYATFNTGDTGKVIFVPARA